uniref:RNA-binding S4 domain-containing protein n=1 Tax=Chlamydomonas leiostraca TaxID=1034604 RepID=A0A7S0RQE4_9CHLO|mmetsp:Transcript_28864/g.73650  ORF Transcript_28864/g.73650 Transcript_28864/m.73650 type:complete len:294 (+) Transcript_28864:51-932(+)
MLMHLAGRWAPHVAACRHARHSLRACVAVRAKTTELGWVAPENREDVRRVLEIADRAADRWTVVMTDFLSPAVLADAMASLGGRSDIVVLPWGGYQNAERCRLVMGREEVMAEAQAGSDPGGVVALDVRGNFMFDPAKHPDFLGAILGTGVVREKVGDILVQGEAGAQILVDPELAEHFETSLTQVRTVPVKTTVVPLANLKVPPPKVEEMNSVEASLRLDALASAGFRMSRSKMADLIKAGDVRVNWKTAARTSAELAEGDVVSCTGKGRIKIQAVTMTKKEKYSVTIMRYT